MHTRPTPNPEFDPEAGTHPPRASRPRTEEERVDALAVAAYLYPHPEPVGGELPEVWPETPYLLLLQGATDNVAEAERVLAPDEDAAWATELMRRVEWSEVYAAHLLRIFSPDPDPEVLPSVADRPEEMDEILHLGALAGQVVRDPGEHSAAYLARVRTLRRVVEEEGETEAEEADGHMDPQRRAREEQLRELDAYIRRLDEELADFTPPERRPHRRARPLSRVVTATLGLVLVLGGLSALSQPYAVAHLAVLCAITVSTFIVWSNLRYDLETSRPLLVTGTLVGLLVGGGLSGLLHDGLTYLFRLFAPQAAATAPGDAVTAGLYGLAALLCWTVAATGAGGLHPPTDPDPTGPGEPETTDPG